MAGLFFCLASAEGAGLLFCPAEIQPHTSIYSTFCAVHAELYHPLHKTAHRALQGLFLQLYPFSRRKYQTDTSGYNTNCDTLEGIPAPGRPQPIPDTNAAQGCCTAQHSPPIIIRYIREQTMPARRGQLLPSADRWQVMHPAHLLRGQRLHLYRVSPAASRYLPRPAA